MAGQASGPERSDVGSAVAAAPAADVAAAGTSKLSAAQPEVCVS